MLNSTITAHTSMKTAPCWLAILALACFGSTLLLRGEEILFHSGPTVATPDLTLESPFPQGDGPKIIKFQREFWIERNELAALPETSPHLIGVPVSAVDAINLVTKDIDPRGGLRSLVVTELRLLKGPVNGTRQVDYYLVSTLADGSEEHRIVLMNRKVLSSKMRRLNDEASSGTDK